MGRRNMGLMTKRTIRTTNNPRRLALPPQVWQASHESEPVATT
jgi:hypothetical protein